MADLANSTPVPTRRAFFAHAALSGVAVTRPPIFTVPPPADEAVIALGAATLALIARSERTGAECSAAVELVCEMTGPAPEKPRDAAFFSRFADYQAAMRRYEADRLTHAAQVAQVEARIGYEALEQAADAAYDAMVEARTQIAAMRATTLDGLIAKARTVGRKDWQDIGMSIVADLLAMS